MDNYRREQTDPRSLQVNQGLTEDVVDDGYYVWRLSPGDFTANAAFPGALLEESGSFAAIKLPDAVTTVVQCQRRRPRFWYPGRFRVDLDYTSPAANIALFSINVQVETLIKAGVVTAPTNLGPGSFTIPGPAVASTLLQDSRYTTSAMTGDAHLVAVRIFRDGLADANNGRLDIVAVTLTLIPAAGH